jgi:hypothetical protein
MANDSDYCPRTSASSEIVDGPKFSPFDVAIWQIAFSFTMLHANSNLPSRALGDAKFGLGSQTESDSKSLRKYAILHIRVRYVHDLRMHVYWPFSSEPAAVDAPGPDALRMKPLRVMPRVEVDHERFSPCRSRQRLV